MVQNQRVIKNTRQIPDMKIKIGHEKITENIGLETSPMLTVVLGAYRS